METTINKEVEVGSILLDVWGYSMTIVDFYRVVKVSPKSVIVEPCASKTVEGSEGYLSGQSVPTPEVPITNVNDLKDGKVKQYRLFRRETSYGVSYVGSLDGYGTMHYLKVWDGRPRSFNHCD
jgi:hypothetical protein